MYKSILFCISVIGIFGCSPTYKLNKEDLEWNPYEGGEILIFQSNKDDIDTIFIKEVKKESVPVDPLAIFQKYYEVLDVYVKHSNPTPIHEHNYVENSFLNIAATSDKNTIIDFDLAAKNSSFYASSYYKKDIDMLPVRKLVTKKFTYNDVIILEPQSLEYYERDEFITAVYWSKGNGYVRYDLKNGVFWELIKKYSKATYRNFL